jgi:hypothetical protein
MHPEFALVLVAQAQTITQGFSGLGNNLTALLRILGAVSLVGGLIGVGFNHGNLHGPLMILFGVLVLVGIALFCLPVINGLNFTWPAGM